MSTLENKILELETKIIKSDNIKEVKKLEKQLDKLYNIVKMIDMDMVEEEFLICN